MNKRDVAKEGAKCAYTTFEISNVKEAAAGQKRSFTGIASTISADRSDDVVIPTGAQYKLPLPLLWQHNRKEPIGWVTAVRISAKRIEVDCEVHNETEPGKLKDRLDEAWQQLRAGLVRGLSIGFNPLKWSFIEGSFGVEYAEWEWLELSPVSIPANQDSSITSIKSFDAQARAAAGLTRKGVVRLGPTPGATGNPSSTSSKETDMNLQEQIKAAVALRDSKTAAMAEMMNKAAEGGTTLDQEQSDKYDELEGEVKSLDKHIERLKTLEKLELAKASTTRVEDGQRETGARGQGAVDVSGRLVRVEALDKGIAFARYAKCLAASRGSRSEALEIAKAKYPDMEKLHTILKAAVAAGTTTDATWLGGLVEYNLFANDFIDYLRPQTIIGKFGQNGIPSLFSVPFNIEIPKQTSGGAGYWVGQGLGKPLTKFDVSRVQLGWAKIANIAVLTEEIVRFSNPSADALVRKSLADAIIAKADSDFLNPSVASVANVSPASLTFGVTPVSASGLDADAVRADIASIMKKFIDANLSLMNGVWVMPAVVAMRLSLMRNSLGQKEFPEISMLGGRLEGLPVIVSQYLPNTVSGGSVVVLMDAGEVYLADDGQVTIDASREASLEMSDAPAQSAASGSGASLVSMFQTNSIAMKAERYINWAKRRSEAAQYIDAVHWGE